MRRRTLLLFAALLLLLSLPEGLVEPVRGIAISALTPFHWLGRVVGWSGAVEEGEQGRDALLALENARLREEVAHLTAYQQQRQSLHELLDRMEALGAATGFEADSFEERRLQELDTLIGLHLRALSARVIYRSPATWSSSLWIDCGQRNNGDRENPVIAKDSPVVIGNQLVGVIDYVGRSCARVRLISDAGLAPSVRSARRGAQDACLLSHIDAVAQALAVRDDLLSGQARQILNDNLQILRQALEPACGALLAKGELAGESAPLWRSRSALLSGTGFNLDYVDREGPARDLRTGASAHGDAIPILKPGDLLVTTGMDGVFPAGLEVAWVEEIEPLREGNYTYKLSARPAAGDLQELQTLFVLPPCTRVEVWKS